MPDLSRTFVDDLEPALCLFWVIHHGSNAIVTCVQSTGWMWLTRWQMGFIVVVKRDPYKSLPLYVTLSEVLTFSVTRMLSYILLLRTSLCQEQAKGKRINTGITRTLAQRLLGLSPYGVSPSLTSAGPFELHPVTS